MAALPAGQVTFVFTDIEGSTRLFQRAGDEYRSLLDDHRRLLRGAFEAHRGAVVATEGDSFFVAFGDAGDALRACLEGQLALARHGWPRDRVVRVRMGLHTGEALPVDGDYVALAVHQGARIAAAAHGGQIVVSDATRTAARAGLPMRSELKRLGEYTLKDFDDPQPLFQLVHPDLAGDLPALRALPAAAHNLPDPRTSFVGRVRELKELRQALATNRLVTVTGPGGVGKTRLVVEAARLAAPDRPGGVRFIDLQRTPAGHSVAPAFASALGVREEVGRDLETSVATALSGAGMLLVVDNCEHVLAGCAQLVAAILAVAPGVSVVSTSREPLGLTGERNWSLSSMDGEDAGRLFAERARAARRDFAADSATAAATASICKALDGLPLALELAAARVAVLSPEQILSRLGDRLALLKRRTGDVTERQQTMRATIEWSYALLDAGQQSALCGLSVFQGGFSADAAEAVAGADLDELQSLVSKSLVSSSGDRFTLLDTIREFAAEHLAAEPRRVTELRRLHAEYFSATAPEIGQRARSSERAALEQLQADHENTNAAFDWAIDEGRIDLCERLVDGLWYSWVRRGSVVEGLERAEAALARSTRPTDRLLVLTGELARFSGRLERSVELKRAAIGLAVEPGSIAAAHTDLAEGLIELGRFEEAEEHARLGLAIRSELGSPYGIAHAKAPFVQLALARGEFELAASIADEAAQVFRSLSYWSDLAWTRVRGATAKTRLGDVAASSAQLAEAIEQGVAISEMAVLVVAIERVAELAATQGEDEAALVLYGAARAARTRSGYLFESDDTALRLVRARLDEADAASLMAAGAEMELDAAIAAAKRSLA